MAQLIHTTMQARPGPSDDGFVEPQHRILCDLPKRIGWLVKHLSVIAKH
jgi:hypothetical protein